MKNLTKLIVHIGTSEEQRTRLPQIQSLLSDSLQILNQADFSNESIEGGLGNVDLNEILEGLMSQLTQKDVDGFMGSFSNL